MFVWVRYVNNYICIENKKYIYVKISRIYNIRKRTKQTSCEAVGDGGGVLVLNENI